MKLNMHLDEIIIHSLYHFIARSTNIMTLSRLQNSDFQRHFLVLKISRLYVIFFFGEDWLGDQLKKFFENALNHDFQ